jgi:CheY-like chemotaxis protein
MNKQTEPGHSRVLVVDDHRISRLFTMAALRQTGCSVKQATSLREGLETMLRWKPETVIVDWNLGDGNGGELVRLARLNWPANCPFPRFVLVTGNTASTLHLPGGTHCFDRVLRKPFSAADLAGAAVQSAGTIREENTSDDDKLHRLFREELQDAMPHLDRLVAGRRTEEAARIAHRLVAGSAICGNDELELAFRRLESSCSDESRAERVAAAWSQACSAANDWLAEMNTPF